MYKLLTCATWQISNISFASQIGLVNNHADGREKMLAMRIEKKTCSNRI